MSVTNPDIVNSTAPLQVCSGLPGGVEAAAHAMRKLYNDEQMYKCTSGCKTGCVSQRYFGYF